MFWPYSKKKKSCKSCDDVMFVMKQGMGLAAATLVSAILAQPDAFRHHRQANWIAETAESDSVRLLLLLLATLIS